jgi:hypothetical protein
MCVGVRGRVALPKMDSYTWCQKMCRVSEKNKRSKIKTMIFQTKVNGKKYNKINNKNLI